MARRSVTAGLSLVGPQTQRQMQAAATDLAASRSWESAQHPVVQPEVPAACYSVPPRRGRHLEGGCGADGTAPWSRVVQALLRRWLILSRSWLKGLGSVRRPAEARRPGTVHAAPLMSPTVSKPSACRSLGK